MKWKSFIQSQTNQIQLHFTKLCFSCWRTIHNKLSFNKRTRNHNFTTTILNNHLISFLPKNQLHSEATQHNTTRSGNGNKRRNGSRTGERGIKSEVRGVNVPWRSTVFTNYIQLFIYSYTLIHICYQCWIECMCCQLLEQITSKHTYLLSTETNST